MKKLIIFGNTIMAKVLHFYFTRDSSYEITCFTVDSKYNNQGKICGLDVYDFESLEEIYPPSVYEMFIAIGPSIMNTLREKKFHDAKAKGYKLSTYISPHAVCDSPVGENSFVGDMATILPFVDIGHNNFFWEQTYIGNDSVVGNHCFISPKSAVGTYARIENNCVLGTSSTIKTSVTVAEQTLVGACCYISDDTEINSVYGERNSEFLGSISHKINISR